MGLLVFVSKIVLTILNSVFAMLSLILVGVGCLIFYAGDIIIPFTNLLLEQLASRGVITQASLDVSGFDIASIAQQIAWPMVLAGAVLFCISFVGCCGANCENKLLLIIYSILMGTIIAAELLAIIVLAGGQATFKAQAIAEVNTYTVSQYRGDNSSDAFSVILNIAQMGLQCCGISNYTDLQTATNWVRTGTFADQNGNTVTGTLEIPFACCNMSEPFPAVAPVNINCGLLPLSSATSYYDTSCYAKVEALINQYSYWAIIGALAFIGTEIAIMLLALLVCHSIGKGINPLI